MRASLICLTLALAASALPALAQAQAAPPATVTFATAAEVQGLIAKARTDRKGDAPTTIEPLLRLAPYGSNVEYRTGVGPAAVHETEAEVFYVIDGAGTLTTGGKLTAETRTNATNLSGTGITGGTARHVAKGDTWVVPQGVPHWISGVDGAALVLMSLHVPRTAP